MIENRFLIMMALAITLPSLSVQASPPPNSINATPSSGRVGVANSFSYTYTYSKSSIFQYSYSKTGNAPWKVIKFGLPLIRDSNFTVDGSTITEIGTIGSYKPVASDVSKKGVIRLCNYSPTLGDLKNPIACVSSPFSVSKK